jgi:DNA-binding transcriptional LysR family regulator
MKGRFALNNAEAIYQAALAGMGIVQLPSFIIGQSIGSGQLKEVLSAYRAFGSPIWIGYQKSSLFHHFRESKMKG